MDPLDSRLDICNRLNFGLDFLRSDVPLHESRCSGNTGRNGCVRAPANPCCNMLIIETVTVLF
jgi:hypothetical protein